MAKRTSNATRATVAGTTVAGGGSIIVTVAAMEMSKRTGLPVEMCAALLAGPVAFVSGLVARWAAKLNPND